MLIVLSFLTLFGILAAFYKGYQKMLFYSIVPVFSLVASLFFAHIPLLFAFMIFVILLPISGLLSHFFPAYRTFFFACSDIALKVLNFPITIFFKTLSLIYLEIEYQAKNSSVLIPWLLGVYEKIDSLVQDWKQNESLLYLQTKCENKIVFLRAMQRHASQEQAQLLEKIWAEVKEDFDKKPENERNVSTLQTLIDTLYPIHYAGECYRVSFSKVEAIRTEVFSLDDLRKPNNSGFFSRFGLFNTNAPKPRGAAADDALFVSQSFA
jgi:hypothetical protein